MTPVLSSYRYLTVGREELGKLKDSVFKLEKEVQHLKTLHDKGIFRDLKIAIHRRGAAP